MPGCLAEPAGTLGGFALSRPENDHRRGSFLALAQQFHLLFVHRLQTVALNLAGGVNDGEHVTDLKPGNGLERRPIVQLTSLQMTMHLDQPQFQSLLTIKILDWLHSLSYLP